MDDEKLKECELNLVEQVETVELSKPEGSVAKTKSSIGESAVLKSKADVLSGLVKKSPGEAHEESRLPGSDRSSILAGPPAQSKALASDQSFHTGKIALAQKVLGERFEVQDVLGQGGMGSVYKVRDLASNTVVALKLLKPELCQDKTVLKRFEYEATSLAELNHENIVAVYDHGITDDGAPYLTMQYLGSSTLADYIQQKGMDAKQSVEITLQLCAALDYAHKRKFVHRDIKPTNVIVVANESELSVQLVDFGIAKILDSANSQTTNLTQTGDVFGTPAYMSPEQCEGKEIDHRSDIYSLGCLLYEMLAGKQPFQGANAIQVAVKHISGKPDRFAEKYPDGHLIANLEQIVFKCMRKEKSERYQSIAELSQDLTMTLSGKELAIDESESEETKKKRHGALIALGSVLYTCGHVLGFIVYLMVTASLFSGNHNEDGTLGYADYERSTMIMLMLYGFALYTYTLVKTNFKKRHSLNVWGEKFIFIGQLSTYILVLISLVPELKAPYTDIVAVGLTVNLLWTWSLLIVAPAILLFNHGVELVKRVQDFSLKKVYVKPTPLPMRFSRALNRYLIATTSLLLVIGFSSPQFTSDTASAFGSVYAKLHSYFTWPTLDWAVEHNCSPGAAANAADIFTRGGAPVKAIEVLSKLIEKYPNDSNYLVARAKAYHQLKRDEAAMQDLDRAQGQSPNNADIFSQRGRLYLSQGQFSLARADFSRAISYTDPTYGATFEHYSDRGLTYYGQQNYREAINDFSKALEQSTFSGRERDFCRRAMAYSALGDPTSARQDFQSAANSYARTGSEYLIKAYAAKRAGDLDAYVRYLAEAEGKGAKAEDLTRAVFGELPHASLTW